MAITLPTTQRCAYLVAPGQVEIREVPCPRPESGQVLLRIEKALAGGTDRKAFARGHPQIPMPGPLGHRYAGTIAALGAGAPDFEVGQRVMGVHSAPCLECDLCRKERWHLCPHVMREKVLGAFAEYLLVPAPVARQNLYPRPASLSPEHATFLEPLACVVHGLEMINWHGVERVLVLGLGAMGLLFAQSLPQYSRAERCGAGRRAARLELAKGLGLAHVWDVGIAPLSARLAPGDRFDCVLESTGTLDGWREASTCAAPGGQVLLFGGLPRETVFPMDSYRLHYEELRVLGSFHFTPRDVAKARDFLLEGRLELDLLISGTLPLARLSEALQLLQHGEGMQYVIDPWQ